MLKHPLLATLLLICFGCSNQKSNSKIITTLERQIDSLTTVSKNSVLKDVPDMELFKSARTLQKQLADSVLRLDPMCVPGLQVMAYHAITDQNTFEAKRYFGRLNQLDELRESDYIFFGFSLEIENQKDSAYHFYELALKGMDSVFVFPTGKPQLLTVLKSKDEGLKELERIKPHISELIYLQISNDIPLYQDEGLTSMFPIWFLDSKQFKFHITVPEGLKEQGILNSMDKVELFFAKIGINVDCTETDNKNNGYIVATTKRYSQRLAELDTLGIKKL